jgi:signal transduction histidine kinase
MTAPDIERDGVPEEAGEAVVGVSSAKWWKRPVAAIAIAGIGPRREGKEHMSIGRRLVLSYILMAALAVLLIIGANVLTGRIKQEFEGLNVQTTRLIPALEGLRFGASEIIASLTEHLLFSALYERLHPGGEEAAHEHEILEEAEEELRHFHEDIKTYETAFGRYAAVVAEHFPGEEGFVEALRETGNGLIQRSRDLLPISAASPTEEELTEKIEGFERAEKTFFKTVDAALAHEQEVALEREVKVDAAVATATASTWTGLLLACAFIFVLGALITRSITRPLDKLTEATKRIGRGEFGTEVDVHGKDETGVLARAFEQMSQDLSSNIAALEKSQSDLKTLNEELEQRVKERTSELEVQSESLICLTDDLLIARDEARAANRTKSEFLVAMSHELRTPLNAVIGFSEIIKDETLGPVGSVQYRDYANDINESGQHLLSLINDILDLSKIEYGADELHEDKIQIPEIIRSALKLVGQRAAQRGIKLEIELPDQQPALRADERKLKQILVNLLSNAVKFTDAGGEVTLRAWCRMDSGHVFQIIDTGVGIAPEDIPKALLRFGQIDSDLNRRYEGTGLGLPLTMALVEQHGGVLDLQSEVSVGTTVTVRFPAERIVASLDNSDSLHVEDRAAS